MYQAFLMLMSLLGLIPKFLNGRKRQKLDQKLCHWTNLNILEFQIQALAHTLSLSLSLNLSVSLYTHTLTYSYTHSLSLSHTHTMTRQNCECLPFISFLYSTLLFLTLSVPRIRTFLILSLYCHPYAPISLYFSQTLTLSIYLSHTKHSHLTLALWHFSWILSSHSERYTFEFLSLLYSLSLIFLYSYFPLSLSHTCKVSSFSFSTKCKYENAAKQKILKSFWTFQFWKIRVCNQETLVLLQMVRKCGN